ncbi:uncharacterized protein Z518_08903 [Rhinocladiella mackenziei CBS 650.93]|uniref:Uncharacterized protein n=1 Tax=Rhinocladiella mackenziei CBS 650.93 TaxID=1442369 RepID=A0A0D2GS74_9EURO|nr:uncharacterized protein Z518_08903 [Rhinocladiella mackenziei CBS 650.93]KIX01178.1 hypothetical protein Z518_08903 [Rhinocladiella mackenziei CBS 650.93]
MSLSDSSPAKKVTLILNQPSDWDEWLFMIKEKATASNVWHKRRATTFEDLTPSQQKRYDYERDDYKRQLKKFERQDQALKILNSIIVNTISRKSFTYILTGCDTPRKKLAALKKRLAPSDRAKELELIRQYNDLKKPPRSRDVDKCFLLRYRQPLSSFEPVSWYNLESPRTVWAEPPLWLSNSLVCLPIASCACS